MANTPGWFGSRRPRLCPPKAGEVPPRPRHLPRLLCGRWWSRTSPSGFTWMAGPGGGRAFPGRVPQGDSALVWKLTSAEDEPNRMAGHGLELLLRTYLPGIFASRTRLVGDGLLDIRSWGTIRVEILEMERLQPMPPEPSPSQIIHMAFVILAFSSAGIMIRDFNKHNWGVRRFSNDGD